MHWRRNDLVLTFGQGSELKLHNIIYNIQYGEWPSVFARLQYCVDNGFLLHGSHLSSIDVLRAGERPICATKVPILAMMFAIRPDESQLPLSEREIWAVENPTPFSQGVKIKATKGFIRKAGCGSVYVVEAGPFRQGKDELEYVSFNPVKPVARIDVGPEDLPCPIKRLPKKLSDYYRSELVRQNNILPW
jgi:hypothetical protein